MDQHKGSSPRSLVAVVACTFAILFASDAILESSASAQNSSTKTAESNSPRKALDVVFQGAWAFVQNEDGSIWAVTPEVNGHTIYPYIRALNEAALGKGSFSLGFKPDKVARITVDSRLKNSLPPNLPDVTIYQKQRYISFQLPKPASIIVLHTDRQVLQDTDPDLNPGYDKSKEKDYATVIAFRYLGSDFSRVELLTDAGKHLLTLEVPHLGSESELFIGVQPAKADEDHSHAKLAFHNLVTMFPPLNLYANFDPNDKPTPIGGGRISRHHSGVDCYAAMLYVDCSSRTKCTIQPLE